MSGGFKNTKNFCVWLTGLPCSGKTTIAKKLAEILQKEGFEVKIFDGDEVRKTITKHLGFSREDRIENALTVANFAREFLKNGKNRIAICSLISPYRDLRERVRKLFEDGTFIEVFVDAPLEVCEKRDKKGLYEKARKGLIKNFTGIDDPYEVPENPEVHLDTLKFSIEECGAKIIESLKGF